MKIRFVKRFILLLAVLLAVSGCYSAKITSYQRMCRESGLPIQCFS